MNRLEAMRILLAVVDAGSLSAGSRRLNAPLASVSRKVAELERHLGAQLLIRTNRQIQLTDSGREYVEAARQIVARIEEAELRAAGEYEAPRGVLTMTVPMAFEPQRILSLAYQFLRDHPEISLNLIAADRAVQLVEEQIDVAIHLGDLGDLADSSLFAVKVGEFRLMTCASPDYLARKGRPVHPEDLVNHDAAVFEELFDTAWTFERDGRSIKARPVPRVRTNTSTATVTAAVDGIGIARAPCHHVRRELRSGALVSILDEFDTRSFPVHLVYLRQGKLPQKVRAFLDWMTPRLRAALKDISGVAPWDDAEPALMDRASSAPLAAIS
ncbi:DNA-binding transcriptional LysR family regulator [Sphingomonas leidyi]|uniref:DNA-binding transcriptional LysR family regulator n=1 Tax=Sphingomonas leidyi TaxID=68569 RepID=A0A7X5UXZ3_9SPHN|nr:LysR family transcriptional regulator [Sphingomonas leidyi]NIJ64223.1 DNA-binding transcriptional LysR family regulator [Sphingomonas leidyi]